MPVPTLRRPHLGPKIRLLSTPADRRVQIKRLVVLSDRQSRWVTRSRQRRVHYEIPECDDHHLLKDLGVSREEACREPAKRFWRQ
jgi:uncharacterized protein YjiS (DUF1127 family)